MFEVEIDFDTGQSFPFYQIRFLPDYSLHIFGILSSQGASNIYYHYFLREGDLFYSLGLLPELTYDEKRKLFHGGEKFGHDSYQSSYYRLQKNQLLPVAEPAGRPDSRHAAAQPTVSGTPTGQGAPGTRAPATGNVFRDALRAGGEGPEMVVIPAGRFRMGCLSNDTDCFNDEKPVHNVTIPRAFALSVHEVTFEDYDRFTYPNKVGDSGWGRGRRPVINVSWDDAKEYVAWLSGETGEEYRLPSESEWEYAARAGTATKYSWGNEIGANQANCYEDYCGDQWEFTAPVGSFAPNRFGLYDMHGNAWEWVEDCWWNASYVVAPSDGGASRRGDCAKRVLRGGSWNYYPRFLRAAFRLWYTSGDRFNSLGFRVARTLTP